MNNENIYETRLDYIDLLKGFAIFLVVMGHFLAWTFPIGVEKGKHATLVMQIIYSFHMPLFFFISGYLVVLKKYAWNISFCLKLLKKRCITLLLPGFSFLLIFYLASGFLIHPWFLMVLFEIYVVFVITKFLLSKCCPSKIELIVQLAVVGLLFFVGKYCSETRIGEILNMSRIARYYLFFVMGYMFLKFDLNSYFMRRKWIYSISFVTWAVLFFYKFVNNNSINTVLDIILALSAILYCWNFAQDVEFKEKKWITQCCINWGNASLAIYLLSPLLTPVFPELGSYIIIADDYIRSGNVSSAKHMTSIFLQITSGVLIGFIVCTMCMNVKKY